MRKKIALVGSFWPSSLEESYARAFLGIGWEVARVPIGGSGAKGQKGLKGLQGIAKRVPILNRAAEAIQESSLVKRICPVLALEKPSIILVFKGLEVGASVVNSVKRACPDAHVVNFNPDSPWERRNSSRALLSAIPAYDHHFSWSHELVARFRINGAKNVSYLPFAYDKELHFPLRTIRNQMDAPYDAVFLGTYDPIRDKLFGELEGCNIAIWGNGWERAKHVPRSWIKGEALYGEEGVRVMALGRVALNILREQNAGSHNMRTFEIPATMLPMMTTRSREQSEFFVEGEEMLCYASAEELSAALIALRNEPDRLRHIANAGYVRVRSETYQKRAATIVRTLGLE